MHTIKATVYMMGPVFLCRVLLTLENNYHWNKLYFNSHPLGTCWVSTKNILIPLTYPGNKKVYVLFLCITVLAHL